MGLFNIKCIGCKEEFLWHSSQPQVCEKCKLPEQKEINPEIGVALNKFFKISGRKKPK